MSVQHSVYPLAAPADDASAVLGAAVAALALVQVEEREVVVVAQLLPLLNVPQAEQGHAVVAVHCPLLDLAVGLA